MPERTVARRASKLPALEMASCTDPGRVREHNEDALACDAVAAVAVLADGMGGYAAGEVASGVAASQICADLARLKAEYPAVDADDLSQAMRESIRRVNLQIHRAARMHAQYAGMGTTVVAAAFTGSSVVLGHAGDSRAYLLRDGHLSRITRDHSLLQEQVEKGFMRESDPAARSVRNLVTRALGVDPAMEPELGRLELDPGDHVVLCSDGLSDMLPDVSIENVLNAYGGALDPAARRLVQEANMAGGMDNISVIIIRFNHGPA